MTLSGVLLTLSPSPAPTPVPGPPGGPGLPLTVGRDDARRAAAGELAKPVYNGIRPGAVHRFLTWLGDEIGKLFGKAVGGGADSGSGGGGWIALVVLLVLLAVVVLVIRLRYGPMRRTAKAERLLFDAAERQLDADGYRRAADAFAAAQAWDEAVRARLRAIIAGLEERTILDRRPGRTADVAAREAGRALPALAGDLVAGARVFDDVWYGGAVATEADYRRLVAVDQAVGAARPTAAAAPADTDGWRPV